MSTVTREVALHELVLDKPLGGDIIDPSGRILLKQGNILAAATVNRWREYGFEKVLLRSAEARQPVGLPDDPLLLPIDQEVSRRVESALAETHVLLDSMIEQFASGDDPQLAEVEEALHTLNEVIFQDPDAALATAHDRHSQRFSRPDAALANRSALLASLAAATGLSLGLSVPECLGLATAGLLHDISLFEGMQRMHLDDHATGEQRQRYLQAHAQHSAQLIGRCRGVSSQVLVLVTQVHEQVDGSGFPRGIGGRLMSVPGRILNLVDAFVTLTDPNLQQSFVPADALAYLMHHTTLGAFDHDCMRALIRSLSVYSVGARVVLDNDAEATVMRSSRTDALRPIVQLDDHTQAIIDLRRSNHYIREPALDERLPGRRRLRRSELDRVLWKPDFGLE